MFRGTNKFISWFTYGGDGNSIGNLLQKRTSGTESGRLHILADVVVDDAGSSHVQADFKGLQHEQRLLEVLGLLHLGDKTEESDVRTVGEDNVGDRGEGRVEGGVDSGLDDATGVLLNTHTDHGDHDSTEDTEEG